jgi:hypothetical protein
VGWVIGMPHWLVMTARSSKLPFWVVWQTRAIFPVLPWETGFGYDLLIAGHYLDVGQLDQQFIIQYNAIKLIVSLVSV